jgi:hypothetical protein
VENLWNKYAQEASKEDVWSRQVLINRAIEAGIRVENSIPLGVEKTFSRLLKYFLRLHERRGFFAACIFLKSVTSNPHCFTLAHFLENL